MNLSWLSGIWRRLWLPLLLVVLFAGTWLLTRHLAVDAQRLAWDASCDLGLTPCQVQPASGQSLTAELAPIPPKVMQPMTLTVTLDAPATEVWADIVGLNMEMGFTRSELMRQADGLWKGQVVLPFCSSAVMHWELRVYLQGKQGLIEVPFRFVTAN